jgi:hypothetical protein
VLSPLLWCLVVDDLLAGLSGSVYAQGYADDICLLAVGKFPNTVSGIMQMALGIVEKWCSEVVCRLIPTRLGSWPLRDGGSLQVSLNPGSSGGFFTLRVGQVSGSDPRLKADLERTRGRQGEEDSELLVGL